MASINKRWASIKSLVKEKKVVVMTRNQSPSPSPTSKSRRLSLADSHVGISPHNMPRFEIPKTIAEMKQDSQPVQRSPRPNRKLLRLNTEHNLISPNKSAPSSPVVNVPVRINDKRRLTIAPIYSSTGSSPIPTRNSSFSKSPSPKHTAEIMAQRSRRASYAPPFIAIDVTGADDDEDQEDSMIQEESINLTLSPSLNSMCDPKYWDNATPDNALRLKPPQRDRLYNRRRSSALSNLSSEDNLSRSTYSLCERDLYNTSKEKIIDRRLSLAPQLAISQIAAQSKPRRTRSANKLEVQYLPDKPALKVTVIRGENIGGRYKSDGLVNPVVMLSLLPGKIQKQTGRVVKATKNPVFNEEFFFSEMDWDTLEHHMLRICVQNQQRFKNDDLGEILLPLLKLDPDIDNRMWKDLRKKCTNPMQRKPFTGSSLSGATISSREKNRVNDISSQVSKKKPWPWNQSEAPRHGRIANGRLRTNKITKGLRSNNTHSIQFHTEESENTNSVRAQELSGNGVYRKECGYLQLRTRFSKQSKKLTILVIKAQDLLRSSLIGPPDTYVRMEVMQNEKRLERKQTKLVKRTKDPLYKEAFSFVLGVSLDQIKHTTVEITVYAKENFFGSAALGQVILGYGSTEESELRHWSLTMREYGKEFTKWHALMPIEDKET